MEARTNSELWGEVIAMARQDVKSTSAFNKLRSMGGAHLTKTQADFAAIYKRFQAQPLFAAQFLLGTKRTEFQQAVIEAMLGCDPATDTEVDELTDVINDFEKGNFLALIKCLDTIIVTRPSLAEKLTQTARTLYPRIYAQLDAKDAADKQLALELEPVVDPAAPALP